MRPTFSAPASTSFQGNNQPLFVQTMNTVKTGFTKAQYDLLIDHQEEDAVDGGFAESTQFHSLLGFVLNDNLSTLTTTAYAFDANQGAAGTSQYVLPRRTRRKLR
jgi:hypothetical protein